MSMSWCWQVHYQRNWAKELTTTQLRGCCRGVECYGLQTSKHSLHQTRVLKLPSLHDFPQWHTSYCCAFLYKMSEFVPYFCWIPAHSILKTCNKYGTNPLVSNCSQREKPRVQVTLRRNKPKRDVFWRARSSAALVSLDTLLMKRP